MKNKYLNLKIEEKAPTVEKSKVVVIAILYITSVLIILSGAVFSVFSAINDISFTVLYSQMPGLVFGVVVTFLGVRYFLSVHKLKKEVYKTTSKFSWSNFKKEKTNNPVLKIRIK